MVLPFIIGPYRDFEVTLRNDECERIANDLGDKSVMILRDHGLLTGPTV